MPNENDIKDWIGKIRRRYESYLKTSFFFREPELRRSFEAALQKEGNLLKGPFPEEARGFETGKNARALAQECFPRESDDLLPALIDEPLYMHQQQAVRAAHVEGRNVVVATGTASGKTESFLYPILFDLYRQHLVGELEEPGVRALILYPMNALANDQRERLGMICKALDKEHSRFRPTFGQYIGQTPQHPRDKRRNASAWATRRLPGELVFRDQMRQTPPHILLTNYSMLEYLLIRPDDSPLFDNGRAVRWKFVVLDEAHQYRGARGMEMGMLVRRLKQRLRDGGRQEPFRCIATSATMSSRQTEQDKLATADFAKELFGESFSASDIIFGKPKPETVNRPPQRYHAFLRALEGAFLVHRDGKDAVVLNRKTEGEEGADTKPLEIALCRECGQHYYVGRERGGVLEEAVRDPSQRDFGVDYYIHTTDGEEMLCRCCGVLSKSSLACDCGAAIPVRKCEPHKVDADQLGQCETCGYRRGGIGDPVQEIVHGSDGPNSVAATALHELLPEGRRKVLAFADSRQEAAFFAWYAEESYGKLRDRNLMLRAIKAEEVHPEGLSIDDLRNRLVKQWGQVGLTSETDTWEGRRQKAQTSILREALTDEKRLSLSGVGLVKWFVVLPDHLDLRSLAGGPWNFTGDEVRRLIAYLLDDLRSRRAMNLPGGAETLPWRDVSPSRPQIAYGIGPPRGRKNVRQWGGRQSAVVRHVLHRLLASNGVSGDDKQQDAEEFMQTVWQALQCHSGEPILARGSADGTFRLNPKRLRISPAKAEEIWECDVCATVSSHNIRKVCLRNRCPGTLKRADQARLETNHYRALYESASLPAILRAEEHTAQIDSDKARRRQEEFKNGQVHLLSSSTTFEVGVDLGDLEAVFLRNVPPEPFNYTQRVGRAGRRGNPGLALTYCRRNPHDLYHYQKPRERVIRGAVRPPRLRMTNEKIVLRHMVAAALSAFFRENKERFNKVEHLVRDWESPVATRDLRNFCERCGELADSLRQVVPENMHGCIGLEDGTWIDKIAGPQSYFASVEAELCADYRAMYALRGQYYDQGRDRLIARIRKRMTTIAKEETLTFLSRKAVIPKYGFPVDVVELDTHPVDGNATDVALQRDLSQAIAEYAPGGRVVANKMEWKSCGVKVVAGREWPVRYYEYGDGDARHFKRWSESDAAIHGGGGRRYLIPEFGFVTPLFTPPTKPHGRARRMYTTRPFFGGFTEDDQREVRTIRGVQVTKAVPGTLVILCEGRNRGGFYICRSCGAHMAEPRARHKSPSDSECSGTLGLFSLGHELVTDVVCLEFPRLHDQWDSYSVGYAVLLGASKALNVPDTDLNVTITRVRGSEGSVIVLYDNVPGGAGLVVQLEQASVFDDALRNARERVGGDCGCDSSCYGCLRSYRNQFAHPYLDRRRAESVLAATLDPDAEDDSGGSGGSNAVTA